MSQVRKTTISSFSYPHLLAYLPPPPHDSLHILSSLLSVHLSKHTKDFLRPWQNMAVIYGKLRIYYFVGWLEKLRQPRYTRVRHACTKLDRSCKERNVDTTTVLVRMLGVCEIGCGILTSPRLNAVQCGVRCYAVYKAAHTLNRRNCLQVISFMQLEILVTWIWRCVSHDNKQSLETWCTHLSFFILELRR